MELLEPAIREGHFSWLIKGRQVLVGIHSEFGWCRRIDEKIVLLNSERSFVPVMPLLIVPYGEFMAFLCRTAKLDAARRQMILDFPFELLLKHVFHTCPSEYWPDLALTWLEVLSDSWPNYRTELAKLSQNKSMPQKTRQRAQRMLRVCISDFGLGRIQNST